MIRRKSARKYNPPGLFEFFMKRFFPDRGEYTTLGDMHEQFLYVAEKEGVLKANWWYRKETLNSIIPLLTNTIYFGGSMIANYFKIGLRNIKRDKSYSFTNIAGLAIGLTTFTFILMYIVGENSYDTFNKKIDRIYRLNKIFTPQTGGEEKHAISSGLMGPQIVNDFPQVEQSVRMLPWFSELVFKKDDSNLKVANVVIADSNLFNVFDYKLIKGDVNTALVKPASIVLSEETAHTLFGFTDPIGKPVIETDGTVYTVTGIVENDPVNSHLQYNAFLSWSTTTGENGIPWMNRWLTQVNYTYLLVKPGTDIALLNSKLDKIIEDHLPDKVGQYDLYLQPLSNIYLNSSDILYTRATNGGNKTYTQIMMFAAMLILMTAGFNYANLTSAKSLTRAKEIGVRKSIGATRKQVIQQFLSESLLLSTIAGLIAFVSIILLMPVYFEFLGKNIPINIFTVGIYLAVTTITVGFISGWHPAYIISKMNFGRTLKGNFAKTREGSIARRIMLGIQFVFSVFLLSGTFVINEQLDYVINKNLGYNPDQILAVPMGNSKMMSNYNSFRSELQKIPGVASSSGLNSLPGMDLMSFGIDFEGKPDNENWTASAIRINDFDLLNTFDMQMAKGRYFSSEFPTDSVNGVVINESLAASLGWSDPIGKKFSAKGEIDNGVVIGVIKNFHMKSLHHKIQPLFIYFAPRGWNLAVKVNPENITTTISRIEKVWKQFDNQAAFEYYFLDEKFAQQYSSDKKLKEIISLFAGFAILVAGLGLLGLISYSIERRIKEIGIRKILGGSDSAIAYLLSREFLITVSIASVIAMPTAYYVMNKWLEDFAFKISLTVIPFLLAALSVFIVSCMLLASHTFKAVRTNPVKSLRME